MIDVLGSADRLSRLRNELVHRLETYSHRIACNRVSPDVAADFLDESIGTLNIGLVYQGELTPGQTTKCFPARAVAITRALRIASSLTRLYNTFDNVKTQRLVDLFNVLAMQVGALVVLGDGDNMAQLSKARIACMDAFLSTLSDDETSTAMRNVLRALHVVDPACGCPSCRSGSE